MRIFIHVPSQTLDVLDDAGTLIARFACSTSRFGLGEAEGSNKTPTGLFRVAEKIGDGAPEGMIFKSRKPTGRIGTPDDEGDNVQTRILWLDGIEPHNVNTHARYIYIHGTNAADALGTPASHGCVRLSDADVIRVFEIVPEGTPVEIAAE